MMKNDYFHYYKKNGYYSNFEMKNHCFGKHLFRLHHFFFDKMKRNLYCSPYFEYCSGEYTKNSYPE